MQYIQFMLGSILCVGKWTGHTSIFRSKQASTQLTPDIVRQETKNALLNV